MNKITDGSDVSTDKISYEINNYNRLSFINKAISMFDSSNCKYLEIGVEKNQVFDSIYLPKINKFGVDPERGGNIRMTSDEFFSKYNETFDVVFIDGLHHYDQCQRDAINALNSLSDKGIILFHDLLPAKEDEEFVPRTIKSQSTGADWTGDVWKVAVELSNSTNLKFCIANIDKGVGILKKQPDYVYNKMNDTLGSCRFNDFLEYYPKLPVVDSEAALKFIETE